MSTPQSETYRSPLHGQPVLRIGGRLARLQLPVPPDPPRDDASRCFFCRPDADRYDEGSWGDDLHVLGNAHPVGERSLLLFPPGPGLHETPLSGLPARVIDALFSTVADENFRDRFGLTDATVCTFANIGRPSGQSRRHLHLQVVAYPADQATGEGVDSAAVQVDRETAEAEGRLLLPRQEIEVVVPRQPGMTAELWIERPPRNRGRRRAWVEGFLQVAAACERSVSASYNLSIREDLDLIRLVPRGLCERAGLELCYPAPLDAVVGATVDETVHLWREALR